MVDVLDQNHPPPLPPQSPLDNNEDGMSSSSADDNNYSSRRKRKSGFAAWEGYCFTLNYILGVGILGIPHAMIRSGFWTGVITMVIVSACSWISITWILEAMARAEAILQYKSASGQQNTKLHYRIAAERKLEIVDIVEIFMGKSWKFTYQICIGVYLFGALWSYASVFGTSMASHVPFPGINGGNTCDLYSDHSAGCRTLYSIWLLLFMLVVVPLSCTDLKEQKLVQISLSIMRFLAIGCMVVSIWASFSKEPRPTSPLPKVTIGGVISFLPVAIYSQIFHHSVPGLTNPLKHKRQASKIYGSVMITTCIMYSLLAISVGMYFGSSVEQACTINWTYADSPAPQVISYFIVLFPALDVISAFPINAITLSNNIYSEHTFEMVSSNSWFRKLRILVRILTGGLPILGALLVSNLDEILKWCGFLGVVIAFIFPGLLNLSSYRKCKVLDSNMRGDHNVEVTDNNRSHDFFNESSLLIPMKDLEPLPPLRNPYSNIFTNHTFVYLFMTLSSLLIVLIVLLTGFPRWFQ